MILAVGLSPVWQHILTFERIDIGQVNRAREAYQCSSGKVINAAMTTSRLGSETAMLSLFGGPLGAQIKQEMKSLNVKVVGVDIQAGPRICTTMIEDQGEVITELVEGAPQISKEELDSFCRAFHFAIKGASCILLMGSLPPGVESSLYYELLKGKNLPIVADLANQELLETLKLKPLLIKPNRAELSKVVGRSLQTDEELKVAMQEMNSLGAQWVVVSDGAKTITMSHQGEFFSFQPPRLKVVNAIGSGDCLAGGIAVGIDEGRSMLDSVKLGIAAACCNVQTILPVRFNRDEVEGMLNRF